MLLYKTQFCVNSHNQLLTPLCLILNILKKQNKGDDFGGKLGNISQLVGFTQVFLR